MVRHTRKPRRRWCCPRFSLGRLRELLLPLGAGQACATSCRAMVAALVFIARTCRSFRIALGLRTGQSPRDVLFGDMRGILGSVVALAPLAWLMTVVYAVQWWATALFALPLYTTRLAYQRFVEMREMFTQTIGALAEAVDKRDPFTAQAQPAGQGDRRRHRAGDARQRRGARGARVGRPAPRRRQDRRAGQRPAQAGAADPRGADDHERAPGAGRADHRAGHEARAGAADHPPPPRVVQRLGLPGPADRRRDPASSPASSTSPTRSRR